MKKMQRGPRMRAKTGPGSTLARIDARKRSRRVDHFFETVDAALASARRQTRIFAVIAAVAVLMSAATSTLALMTSAKSRVVPYFVAMDGAVRSMPIEH